MSIKRPGSGLGSAFISSPMEASKHANLLEDFVQLQKEFSEMKDHLESVKEKRTRLLAEVRFLRRRFQTLKQSQEEPNANKISLINLNDRKASKHRDSKTSSTPSAAGVKLLTSSKSVQNGNYKAPFTFSSPLTNPSLPPSVQFSSEFVKKKELAVKDALKSKPKPNADVGGSALKSSALKRKANTFAAPLSGGKRKIKWQDQITLECN